MKQRRSKYWKKKGGNSRGVGVSYVYDSDGRQCTAGVTSVPQTGMGNV